MRRLGLALALCLALAAAAAPAARAASPSLGNFGLYGFDVAFEDGAGGAELQAGAHPFAVNLSLGANFDEDLLPEGRVRDLTLEQVPGLLGDTTAYRPCTSLQFLQGSSEPACPLESAVGVTANSISGAGSWITSPLYNVAPPPGVLLRLGFAVEVQRIVIDVRLSPSHPNSAVSAARNIAQILDFFGNVTQLWGDPSDDAHDELRGPCGATLAAISLAPGDLDFPFAGKGKACGVEDNPKPLLTLPTYCGEPLRSSYQALSWEGETDSGSALTHDDAGAPAALEGCGRLGFKPSISALPSSRAASGPTGLELSIEFRDEGLTSLGEGERRYAPLSQSRIRKAVFTLPEGMTANPSVAEGLEACSEADLRRETLEAEPGEGCPQASKLGTIEVRSPLVERTLEGSLYIAEPHRNRFGTLLAFFIVVKDPALGILVKQATRVEPDPRSGRLVGIAEDIPPTAAFSSFRLRFREGGRSPLISPPACGVHEVEAELTPWSGAAPAHPRSSFETIAGPGGGPCPPAGEPPFEPGFQAGSENNAAGEYSPFSMRLTRRDGDQDLTRFDAVLPPGVVARLAGVGRCPDAQIALAQAKSGRAELASPSCPLDSQIGTVSAGAGVGSQLTYVPGRLYMAGPFGGAPLSVLGVVPAVAGPFDVGTVVVRQALDLDPRTGEVSVDGSRSDPIPHILAGIPLAVRDIQVRVDRSGFTLNPTACDPFATRAAIWGGGSDLFSALDDSPAARSAPYQAASCLRLGFAPRLGLRLRGGSRRGANPALRGVYRAPAGNANLKRLVLRFPRSAFLDQSHIRTVCTRVQFAADACPRGAIYGRARVFTPLLAEPLQGPVYLRSSDNRLPDVVFDLRGIVDVEASARVDSRRGALRVAFTGVPDAPVSRAVVLMQGARKGLIVNSTDLCTRKRRAALGLLAHSGKRRRAAPVVRPSCGRRARRAAHRR